MSVSSPPDYADCNHWLNVLQIDKNLFKNKRDFFMSELGKNGIETRPIWQLNHLQRPYERYQSYKIENAEHLIKNSLCLPSSPSLSNDDIGKVIDSLNG